MSSEKQKRKMLLGLFPEKERSPPCPHVHDECGGCMFQEWEYGTQLSAKKELLEGIYGMPIPITGCQDEFAYRNRMDYTVAFGKMGLRKRGKFDWVVDVADCLLLPDRAREAFKTMKRILFEEDVRHYNYLRHEGFLRYAVLRASRATDELMIIFTTTTPTSLEEHGQFQSIIQRIADETGAESVHWTVNDSKSEQSIGERYWLTGREYILDEIASRQFRVYPETFFQANTLLAEALFLKAAGYVRGTALDLYCGPGTISIIAEHVAEKLVGVDNVKENIEAAKENAILNGVPKEKCVFLHEDAAIYLEETDMRFDTVICDPARPGLGKRACNALLAKRPGRIIYISCNPTTHKQDIDALSEEYALEVLEAYDLFPQTPHVEVFSVLEAKNGTA